MQKQYNISGLNHLESCTTTRFLSEKIVSEADYLVMLAKMLNAQEEISKAIEEFRKLQPVAE